MEKLILSKLNKTWLLDLDGTIVFHNEYLKTGTDRFIEGAKEFLQTIPKEDYILFLTARKVEYKELTEIFLKENNIRYNKIIYDLPHGERILINDDKPSGLKVSYAISKNRDEKFDLSYCVNKDL